MMNELKVSQLNRRKFWTALATGFILFIGLISTFGFSGTLYAVGLGGMGDFFVSFDKLEGQGFRLHPHIGETGNEDRVPMVRNEIQSAKVENLHIYKDLQLPTGNWIRIHVKAHKPTVINGLIQDARFVDANLVFDDLTVRQRNTKNSEQVFFTNWSQHAQTVTIYNAKIVTDYLFQNTVSLNEAEIYIEAIDHPDRFVLESPVRGHKVENGRTMFHKGGGHDLGKESLPQTATGIGNVLITGCVLLVVGVGVILFIKKKMGGSCS